jgi:beta-1,4-N-acetylglucosaminyltransferase
MSLKRVVYIASTGGHLNELLQFKPLFEKTDFTIITENNPSAVYLKEVYPKRVFYLLYGSKEHLFSYLFKFTYNAFLCLKA